MTNHAEELAKLGWQYFECPACGSEGARAFSKSEQKPVAWMVYTQDGQSVYVTDNPTHIQDRQQALPLYTTSPQLKPLTLEQQDEIVLQASENDWHDYELIAAVEAAHGIKE